ncbi:MAG: LiaF domain-containing protein [Spirochaetota bacterium]
MSQTKADDMEMRRQEAIDALTSAFAGNIISMEEYERRATLASAADFPEALDEVVADLPATRPGNTASSSASYDSSSGTSRDVSRNAARSAGRTGYRGTRFDTPSTSYSRQPARDLGSAPPLTTGCVMGDRNLTGNWLTSNKVSSFTVMGSTKLDLRDSDLPLGPISVEVFTLMGETRIIVPPGLPVRMNAFAFMAESTAHRSVNQQVHGADTWVEISGFVMMGSVVVKAMD